MNTQDLDIELAKKSVKGSIRSLHNLKSIIIERGGLHRRAGKNAARKIKAAFVELQNLIHKVETGDLEYEDNEPEGKCFAATITIKPKEK